MTFQSPRVRHQLTDLAQDDLERLTAFGLFVYERVLEQLLLDPSNDNPIIRDMSPFEIEADAVAVTGNTAVWFDRIGNDMILIKGIEWRGPDAGFHAR